MIIEKTEIYSGIQLNDNQLQQVSSVDKIQAAMRRPDCVGFNAVESGENIGFALFRRFDDGAWFLWNLLIDFRHQGKGKSKAFMRLLIAHLRDEYGAKIMTTTYIFGNTVAKRLYESLGFVETDVVCEDDVHEVNMKLNICDYNTAEEGV